MLLKKSFINIFLFFLKNNFLFKFNNLFYLNYPSYNSKYFFNCIKLLIIYCNPHNSTLLIKFVINYKFLRFIELTFLDKIITMYLKSKYFISFDNNFILPYNNFILKTHFYVFLSLNSYLEFFRRFKYNEYLKPYENSAYFRKNNMVGLNKSKLKRNFLTNFFRRRFLIIFRENLNSNVYFYNYKSKKALQNVKLGYDILNTKFSCFFFNYFKIFLRIYFILFSYQLYFLFKEKMRPFVDFFFMSINSVFDLNFNWRINLCKYSFKLILNNSFHSKIININNNLNYILNLDLLFLDNVIVFYLFEYFSNLYYYMYSSIHFKFKNRKRRKLHFFKKIYIVLFRAFISFYHYEFLDLRLLIKTDPYLPILIDNVKYTLDFLTWSIFSNSFNILAWPKYMLLKKQEKISNILLFYRRYLFHICFINFVKLYNINKNYMYFFLIKIICDFLYKVLSYIKFELNKKIFITNYYYFLLLQNNEYKYFRAKHLFSIKLFKYDNYSKLNLDFFIDD